MREGSSVQFSWDFVDQNKGLTWSVPKFGKQPNRIGTL